MQIRISVDRFYGAQRLHAWGRYIPLSEKLHLDELPGAIWRRPSTGHPLGAWTYPATEAAIRGLQEVFWRRTEPNLIVTWDTSCSKLTEAALAQDATAAYKDDDIDLEPITLFPTHVTPWRHQLAAYHWCQGRSSGLIWSAIGTGKTNMAIWTAAGAGSVLNLVLCKKRAIGQWRQMIAEGYPNDPGKFIPDVKGTVKAKTATVAAALEWAKAGRDTPTFIVLNWESAWREPLGRLLVNQDWDLVIVDECHKIKSAGSKVSMWAKLLARRAKRRFGYSGTPIENPLEAYGIFRFLDAGMFGTSFLKHRARYAVMEAQTTRSGQDYQAVIGWQNLEEFHAKLSTGSFYVSGEVLELPPMHMSKRTFAMGKRAQALYDGMRHDFLLELPIGPVTGAHPFTRYIRLQQITSGYVQQSLEDALGEEPQRVALHEDKMDALIDVLDEIDEAEDVLVFCRFHWDLDAVKRVGEKVSRPVYEISGRRDESKEWLEDSGTYEDRHRQKEDGVKPRFSADTGAIVVCQIAAASESLDYLSRARYTIFYSVTFELRQMEQAMGRTRRGGQEREQFFIMLCASGTIDQRIYEAIAAKENLRDAIIAHIRE